MEVKNLSKFTFFSSWWFELARLLLPFLIEPGTSGCGGFIAMVLEMLCELNVMLPFLRKSVSAVFVRGFMVDCLSISWPTVCKLRWLLVSAPSVGLRDEIF